MDKIPGIPVHEYCPKDWRKTPVFTGSFELDATIARCANADMPNRLKMYADSGNQAYGPRTGYNGYKNYGGDS